MACINPLPPLNQPMGYYDVRQYIFNPLNMLGSIFVLYCFLTTSVMVKQDSYAQISKYLWIVYTTLDGFQDFLFYFFAVLPNVDPIAFSSLLILVLQLNSLITQIVLLTLHIFFPEAVLFSYEQLVKASKSYKAIELGKNKIQSLFLDRIKSYLKSLPDELRVELFEDSGKKDIHN